MVELDLKPGTFPEKIRRGTVSRPIDITSKDEVPFSCSLMRFQDVSRSSADLVETIKRLPVCWWVLLAGQLWFIWPNPANVNDVQFLLIIFWQCWPLPRKKMWHQIKMATKKHRSVACLKIRHTRSRRGIIVLLLQGLRQDRCWTVKRLADHAQFILCYPSLSQIHL